MPRLLAFVIAAGLLLPRCVGAQAMPDFSGVWELDDSRSDARGVYGQVRVVTQTPTEVDMAVVHFASGTTSVAPWRLPFDRWRPRRGGEQSREPVVQARWDGRQLVIVKAPGTSYSVLWIWTLSDSGNELTVDAVSTTISFAFDFKASSAPRGYISDRHVYTRVPASQACDDCAFALHDRGVIWNPTVDDSPVALRLRDGGATLSTTCLAAACRVTDIVNGRQTQQRMLAARGSATASMAANTVIAAKE